MISMSHRFIFLHVPKTGGNAVQSYLLPHGDDRKVISGPQDGVDRFGVRGAITPNKHATLQSYADALGPGLDSYKTILPIRDPLERALSLYFTPQRGAGRPADFVPAFRLDVFADLLRTMPGIVHYLRVGGVVRRPDFVLHFESLERDLAAVAAHFGLPVPVLPVLNRSLDRDGQRRAALRRDPEVVALVRECFAEDFAYFDF
jgi:hypothetical protein